MANVGEVILRVFNTSLNSLIMNKKASDAIWRGNGWVANYSFDLAAEETAYLVFEASDKYIHVRNRSINAVDLENNVIDVTIETLKNATIDALGNDISENIVNANLNENNSIELNAYDETTTITDEGNKVPFSGTIAGDKKRTSFSFIEDEYILKLNDYLVLKFENNGSGDVRIEYHSNGYQHD